MGCKGGGREEAVAERTHRIVAQREGRGRDAAEGTDRLCNLEWPRCQLDPCCQLVSPPRERPRASQSAAGPGGEPGTARFLDWQGVSGRRPSHSRHRTRLSSCICPCPCSVPRDIHVLPCPGPPSKEGQPWPWAPSFCGKTPITSRGLRKRGGGRNTRTSQKGEKVDGRHQEGAGGRVHSVR